MTRIVKNPIKAGDGDPRHGTNNGYTNYGCRCDLCRKANAIYVSEYRKKNPEKIADQKAIRDRFRYINDPEYRRKKIDSALAAHHKRYHNDPEYREKLKEYSRNRYWKEKAEREALKDAETKHSSFRLK